MFEEITVRQLDDNFFARFGDDWGLLAAGTKEMGANAMTISWGQAGILWGRPVVTVYVRPQRYTRQFIDKAPGFSVSFFAAGARRPALELMGSKSGRDGDKMAEAELSFAWLQDTPVIEQSQLVLVCNTLYVQEMDKNCFISGNIPDSIYPENDYHCMYVGEVTGAWRGTGLAE